MKNIVGIVVVLCLFLFPSTSSLAEPKDGEFFTLQALQEAGLSSLGFGSPVWCDGAYYACTFDALYCWKPEAIKPEKVCQLPEFPDGYWGTFEDAPADIQERLSNCITAIVPDGSTLRVLNMYTGKIGEITSGELRWSDTVMDISGMFADDGKMRSLSHHFLRDGKLFMLRDDDGAGYTIVVFDIDTGSQSTFATTSAKMMCPYTSDKVLLWGEQYNSQSNEFGSCLFELDITNGIETIIPLEMPKSTNNLGGFAYDTTSDSIFYTYQGQVWRSLAGSEFEPVAYIPIEFVAEESVGLYLSDGMYVITSSGVYTRNINSEYRAERVLRVQGSWDSMKLRAFIRENPDVPVIPVQEYASGKEIAQAITLGNQTMDIYTLDVVDGFRGLVEKGYVADLSASPKLATDISTMYPAVQNVICDDGGRPVGYPIDMGATWWARNTVLWEQIGLGAPPATYSELLDMYLVWQDSYAENYPDAMFMDGITGKTDLVELLINAYIQQYETSDEPLDFNVPILRELLEKMNQIDLDNWNPDTMTEADWARYYEQNNRAPLILPYGSGEMFVDSPENAIELIPPVFEVNQKPIASTRLNVMFVNPASQNIDLALRFIEFYAHMDVNPLLFYALHPDQNEPLLHTNFEEEVERIENWRSEIRRQLDNAAPQDIRTLEDNLAFADKWMAEKEQNKWLITKKALENYRSVAQYISFSADSMYLDYDGSGVRSQLGEVTARYCAGQLTIEAYLKELTSKTRIAFLEGK